ncbi:MAG: hypothetical protein KF720_03210 [Rubrivivax sp.]|nr:hypothetical protein [Rubrivivax sp.]
MPHLIVYSPRLTREVKIACAEALTRAFESTTGHSSELLTIHFEEHSYDNIAVGGKLLTDSFPELAKREKDYQARSK